MAGNASQSQVEFGEATIRLAGPETKVALFVRALPFSGAPFVQAFPSEYIEKFLEGHRRLFEYFGGVPKRIDYDESAIALIEVLTGRERKLTREFLWLQGQYLLQEHFRLVRRANEKRRACSCGSGSNWESWDLLILDELSHVPVGKARVELLFDEIATAHERYGLVVLLNLALKNWIDVPGGERMIGAALDRLTHRCHILETKGQRHLQQDANRRRRRSG